ncbi:MAG: 16S rRNA (uracil(1498)-N(3))-methyltransferase [Myxococcales bacterium]|jgi:16S rRNA (uracil1498-N3)-methyltransferase|nr:16S rRNA (uracil(1498)-N(3))-methyltransferase [Myxococcales bacterium]
MTTRLLLSQTLAPNTEVRVDGPECHYLVRVRRHVVGDAICLRDAQGVFFNGTVTRIEKDAAHIRVDAEMTAPPAVGHVHLLVAVPKGTLFDEVVRRLTEIGVQRLTPLHCERSVLRPGQGREQRWRRISEEATRQCGRSHPMQVDPFTPFATALATLPEATRWTLHPQGDSAVAVARQTGPLVGPLQGLVGPEGGFTPHELDLADAHGFRRIHMGPHVLRVETATVVAAALFVSFLGGMD